MARKQRYRINLRLRSGDGKRWLPAPLAFEGIYATKAAARRAAYNQMYLGLQSESILDRPAAHEAMEFVEAWPSCGDMSVTLGHYYWLTLERFAV